MCQCLASCNIAPVIFECNRRNLNISHAIIISISNFLIDTIKY